MALNLRQQRFVEEYAAGRPASVADRSAGWVLRHLMHEATDPGLWSSHAARVRALELLGRRLGLFTEKVEGSGVVRTAGRCRSTCRV